MGNMLFQTARVDNLKRTLKRISTMVGLIATGLFVISIVGFLSGRVNHAKLQEIIH